METPTKFFMFQEMEPPTKFQILQETEHFYISGKKFQARKIREKKTLKKLLVFQKMELYSPQNLINYLRRNWMLEELLHSTSCSSI